MRKRCNRKVRNVSEPAMVRMSLLPEVELGERLAIEHLRWGTATYDNCYRPLADVHGALTLGVRKYKDETMHPILDLAYIAIINMYDRYMQTKRFGATGDEIQALQLMIDASHDWWNRKPASALEQAVIALSVVRSRQVESAKKEAN